MTILENGFSFEQQLTQVIGKMRKLQKQKQQLRIFPSFCRFRVLATIYEQISKRKTILDLSLKDTLDTILGFLTFLDPGKIGGRQI